MADNPTKNHTGWCGSPAEPCEVCDAIESYIRDRAEMAEATERLTEEVRKSREDLARFPLWLTTGSQKDYDDWMLGREPSFEEKVRRIGALRDAGQS